MWRWETRERRFRASTRGLNPSLWRPRYKWDARRIRGRDGSEDFLQPSAVRNSRKRLDSNNFFFVASRFSIASALTWATETVTFASVTQRESNRLHDAPLLYTPRTITTSLHFPARTPGKARGAGGTRVAGTSRTSPLVAGRARARSRSRAPRPSRARILIGRSGRSGRDDRDTSTSRLPRALDPGPGLSPSSRWARRSSSPPGARLTPTAATRWRSRQRRCPTARWRRSGSSRPTTEARISSARGAAGRVGTRPRRWARRPCGACAGTRRARSALAPRAMGWRSRDTPRGRSGSGGTRSARRRPSPRRGARASSARRRPDSDAARARRAARRRVWVRASETRARERCARRGAQSIAFEKPFAASSRTPGEWRASVAVSARETTSATRTSPRGARPRVGDDSEPFGEALRVAFPGGAREASDDPRVEGERRVAEPETAGGRDPGDEKKRREKSRLARRRRPRRVRSARAKVTRKATRREATRVLFP